MIRISIGLIATSVCGLIAQSSLDLGGGLWDKSPLLIMAALAVWTAKMFWDALQDERRAVKVAVDDEIKRLHDIIDQKDIRIEKLLETIRHMEANHGRVEKD